MFVNGPRNPSNAPKPGLLGADYTIEHVRYRFAKITTAKIGLHP